MRLVEIDTRNELRTQATPPHLYHPDDDLRDSLTGDDSPTSVTATSHQRTRNTPTSLTGGNRRAQVSPVFVRVCATGRRPGSFKICSSPQEPQRTHITPSQACPSSSLSQLSCTSPRLRATTAYIKNSPSPLSVTPSNRHQAFISSRPSHQLSLIQTQTTHSPVASTFL